MNGFWHLPLQPLVCVLAVAFAASLVWLYVSEVRRARRERRDG